ncbi:MAG TPA: hypothetical protein VLU46_15870 [Thermoanaerobaculia bacterium]|nr:hypothetical protein [Thermoanaerobaculia bacterium]
MSARERTSVATAAAIGVVAYAVMDMVHEAGGHWLSTMFVPAVHVVSISTVGLHTQGESRVVAAAGTIANLIAGTILMWLCARRREGTTSRYFLWLAGTVNLMEVGYLVYSGVSGLGDWSVVVQGLPARIAMIVAGLAGYIFVVRLAARLIDVDAAAVIVAYVAGSALMIAGAAMNPLRHAILLSGLPAGFAMTAGLLAARDGKLALPFSRTWIIAGLFVAAAFVLLLGPGVPIAR